MTQTVSVPLSEAALDGLAQRLPVPGYDRSQVTAGVVHIGVGGFHRAHQAMFHDRLMNAGLGLEWGICGLGVMPPDRAMGEALVAQDGLYTLVVKHADGTCDARVIGSIMDYVYAPEDPERAIEVMASPATRIVSLTITEGGYVPDAPPMAYELVTESLRRRRDRGQPPFTVMSCDNLEGNGDRARAAFAAFARRRDAELGDWVEREVSFPNAMVDRITPATTDGDRREVAERFGIEDRRPVVCEPFAQWVLEDAFPLGRPPYEQAGVQLVGDVRPYELMKLRLLNASHQGIAYFGHLCGYALVHDAAQDPTMRAFLSGYMDEEATPTLDPLPGVDLDDYKRTLIERFSNPQVRDTIPRLCAESSDRIPKWVLPVIREQLARGGELRRAAAIVASWARYAEGVDEQGRPIEIVDSRRDALMARARSGDPEAFIADRELFGDLAAQPRFVAAYRAALDSLHERGARATLERVVAGEL